MNCRSQPIGRGYGAVSPDHDVVLPLSAPWTTSSWAWSCAIRVNWTRNSRSALASRWFTVQSDSMAGGRRTAPEARGGDAEANACRRIANFSNLPERMSELGVPAVLNGTPCGSAQLSCATPGYLVTGDVVNERPQDVVGGSAKNRMAAETARSEAEQVRRRAEEAREVRDHDRESLETVRQERERLRETAETARIASEDARRQPRRRAPRARKHESPRTLRGTPWSMPYAPQPMR